MADEIKKNEWLRFCKSFNVANQYRPNKLIVKSKNNDVSSMSLTPFMGMSLRKKGRTIGTLQLCAGRARAEDIVEPVMTIKEPERISLEKDQQGNDTRLRIWSKDGTEVTLELTGDKETDQYQQLIEQIAYSLFEHRGHSSGQDMGDWFEAERLVKNAEKDLTK